MNQKQARKLCREWQKELRLQDWDISIAVVPQHEMGSDNRGDIAMKMELRVAHICIVKESHTTWQPRFGPEQTIVHELLHPHFQPFWDDSKELEMEQAIEAIAAALVSAKRDGPK